MLDDGWSYILVDFVDPNDDHFELDEGTDVALADIEAVTAAVAARGDFE
jgi:hypothetical protein